MLFSSHEMILLRELLLLLNFWLLVNGSNSFDLGDGHSGETNAIGEACRSKDIRFSVQAFNQLKNCGVIEGHLTIAIMDGSVNGTIMDGLEFPLLTEVTEFVIFYRVLGLTSLGKLFPNLRVIRGNSLIADYSLIVFEMPNLKEIGLKSLIEISRGSVRIERNPLLCFADTIEWSLITSNAGNNFISNNKQIDTCPTCPGVGKSINGSDVHSFMCPELNGKNLCWNRSNCQQLCPSICGNSTCNAKGECCDESCLGCDGTGKCLTCRHLNNGSSKGPQCVKSCPPNRFSHENRRCITESECHAIRNPIVLNNVLLEYPFLPHDGECSMECPRYYNPTGPSGNRKCKRNDIMWMTTCPRSVEIDSISSAQRYRGCQYVPRGLVINIRNRKDYTIVHELEKSLADIEVIEGNLVIKNSYQLQSLEFFKKLRLLKNGGREKYAIKVIGNQNLQSLFAQNVTINQGRMFFHFNPKLCLSVIEKFKSDVVDLADESSLNDDEVAPDTNGDKSVCKIEELNVKIESIDHDKVVMQLAPLAYEQDQRLGYLISYMPAPYRNVTMFEGSETDKCMGSGWEIADVPDDDRNSTTFTIILTQLIPDTQYAYYIQTYVVANDKPVAFTNIEYFRTLVALEVTTNAPVSVHDSEGKCVGICKKTCPAGHIYGVLTAQRYRGCTHINGQLVIDIRKPVPNTVRELENSLGSVEIIEGNLIIKRSYPLLSLGFFKNLRLVRNSPIGKEKYGIKLIGNQNLEALFSHNVTIEHGGMFSHFNPKLCLSVIETFKSDVVDLRNESRLTDDEVAPDTNGDKTACNMKELHVEIRKIGYDSVAMQIVPILFEDFRILIGYLMYYMPAEHQNVTMFDGGDACGGDGWQMQEIIDDYHNSTPVQFIVTQLKPDTQYAYFIRTNTVGIEPDGSESDGGSTSVKYFRTAGTASYRLGSPEVSDQRDPPKRSSLSIEDVEETIAFENEIQNIIYMARRIVKRHL